MMPARIMFLLFSAFAIAAAAQSSYIQLKGKVAQYLLNEAWDVTLEKGTINKPWPWADTWPVAKISIPSQNKSMIVLDGVSGEAMAFGPARLSGRAVNRISSIDGAGRQTNLVEKAGTESRVVVIGGHRDTHLAFLQDMEKGQEFVLQTVEGHRQAYRWTRHVIANADTDILSINAGQSGLVLITCYPFNATQTGGSLRFIVIAEPVDFQSYSSNLFSNGYFDMHS